MLYVHNRNFGCRLYEVIYKGLKTITSSLSFGHPLLAFIFLTIFLKLETAHTRENSPPAFSIPLKMNRLKPPSSEARSRMS